MDVILYSRTRFLDYRLISKPSETVCPQKDFPFFLSKIRSVINTDTYSGDLKSPRWLFVKSNGVCLLGIGSLSSNLNQMYSLDYVGQEIRSFIGVFWRDGEISVENIPYSLRFFSELYTSLIQDIWIKKQHSIECEKYLAISPNELSVLSDSEEQFQSVELNFNQKKIKVFPKNTTFLSLLIPSFLSHCDVSSVSNIADKEHILTGTFMNVIGDSVSEELLSTNPAQPSQSTVANKVGTNKYNSQFNVVKNRDQSVPKTRTSTGPIFGLTPADDSQIDYDNENEPLSVRQKKGEIDNTVPIIRTNNDSLLLPLGPRYKQQIEEEMKSDFLNIKVSLVSFKSKYNDCLSITATGLLDKLIKCIENEI